MKIGLRGGHSPNCKGAIGLIDEQAEVRKIYNELAPMLQAVGHTVVDCNSNASNQTMNTIASNICKNFAGKGFANRGVKYSSGYHDLNASNMPGMIVETLFCTGTGDVARYRNLGTKGIAELIAKAIDSRASACSEQKNNQNTGIEQEGEEEMKCLFTVEGKGAVYYFDGQKVITLGHPDELKIIQKIYKDNNGKDIPCYKWSPKAPWYARLMSVIYSKETTSI